MTPAIPSPHQVVHVRSRRYLVEEVIPPPLPGQMTRVRLSCVEDDAQGTPLEVLWESELDAEVLSENAWQSVAQRGFDDPRRFSAYLHAQRWSCVTSTNARLFQAPYRAGIEVMAYQLEPLRMALQLPRVNLFIADDVGLGKTIEAGLILRELIMRQKVRRVVVACPPSVLLQWRDELDSRFGLSFVVFDREYVLARRRERGYGVNPWDTHSRFLISHALLRDEAYAGPLRDWLGDFQPGSLLILDEAHNAAPASAARYAVDSHLTRAVRDVAKRFEHRLFLSATPHNGHSNSFAALLEILDPHRFCRGVPVKNAKLLEQVMVRRLKSDLRGLVDGIPDRKVEQVDIQGLPDDAPDLLLPRLLAQYRELREERMESSSKTAQAASALVVISLQKRLLSSIEAFACTLRVHRSTLERKERERSSSQSPLPAPLTSSAQEAFPLLTAPPGADDGDEEPTEERLHSDEEAQMQAATSLLVSTVLTTPKEHALLDEMERVAEAARNQPDARVRALIAWLRENCCPQLPEMGQRLRGAPPTWNHRRVLIFTEYVDTKRYLEARLREAISQTDNAEARIACFIGGNDQSREDIKRAFNADPAREPLRILIATDAAREGVNLQNHCFDLFHFDVPWNPSRLEQRNGRIDRKLQRSPEVYCRYFYYRQRPEDRVLRALVEKTKTIRNELGSLAKVLEGRLEQMFGSGIVRADVDRLAGAIEASDLDATSRATVKEELEASRKKESLNARLNDLRDILKTSSDQLGLDTGRFRDALSESLGLLGAPPLSPLPAQLLAELLPDDETKKAAARGDSPSVFQFPDLGSRAGASWTETLDSLRVPRKRDQSIADWRKECPVRPVIFNDVGSLDDRFVHLHLEHRLVQRLLGRFIAAGFIHDDLSRACVVKTNDPIPRIVILGRLSLYGEGATRLHDEILTVTARWQEVDLRKEPLRPYAADAEEKTLNLLEQALAAARPAGDIIEWKLRALAEKDVLELLSPLQSRADRAAEVARKQLAARGDKEARDMTEILGIQKQRIEDELAKRDGPQLELHYNEMERRQRDAEREHMTRRLLGLDGELQSEPERIRKSYEVRASRVEPLGVVYLWPQSS